MQRACLHGEQPAREDTGIAQEAHQVDNGGGHMWFWIGGGITIAVAVLLLLRKNGAGSEMGSVSDDWLARQRASRRIEP